MLGILGGEGKQENKNEVQEMENYGAEAGSAVKLLEELLNLGYRKNASDIHLEPQEDRMVVRMRLDGMLLHVREYDKEMHQPLVTRAKVLSGMDIAKRECRRTGVEWYRKRNEGGHIVKLALVLLTPCLSAPQTGLLGAGQDHAHFRVLQVIPASCNASSQQCPYSSRTGYRWRRLQCGSCSTSSTVPLRTAQTATPT